MKKLPKISFIIPILNNEEILEDCLGSIKIQDYPKSLVEIIIPDGGSSDKSVSIAEKYKCIVIKNEKILAEPGFMLGASKARGQLIVYMGADNRLSDKKWIRKMIKPFENENIIGAYPWHKNHKKNTWLTKYFNTFTDPLNHFILGNACNPIHFNKEYRILKKTSSYVLYDFSLENFPLIAFDQGFMSRRSYNRPKETEYDDILPVLNLIMYNSRVAFVPKASNYHYTLEKGVSQYIKKIRWIVDNDISPNASFGLPTRIKYFNLIRKMKLYFWPIYAISVIGPIVFSLIGYLRDGKREWAYHFPITLITIAVVIYEVLRIKVFRRAFLSSRQ